MKKLILFCLSVLLAASLPAMNAMAMSVTPVVLDMKATGNDARSEISVKNTSAVDLPIAVNVYEAKISNNGEVTKAPADDQFMIFPPQAIIDPNGLQKFRVQWVGDPELQVGKTYIFSVAQQPVALAEGTSGVQILYNFEVLVNVSPTNSKPELVLTNSVIETQAGKRRAAIDVENLGVGIGYVSASRLKIEAKDKNNKLVWSKNVEASEFTQIMGVGIVGSKAKRHFVLPFDLPDGAETLSASLRYVGNK